MNRDEFEVEYVKRNMKYDPRNDNSKLASVSRLRDGDNYTDSHIDLCWKVEKSNHAVRLGYSGIIEW